MLNQIRKYNKYLILLYIYIRCSAFFWRSKHFICSTSFRCSKSFRCYTSFRWSTNCRSSTTWRWSTSCRSSSSFRWSTVDYKKTLVTKSADIKSRNWMNLHKNMISTQKLSGNLFKSDWNYLPYFGELDFHQLLLIIEWMHKFFWQLDTPV